MLLKGTSSFLIPLVLAGCFVTRPWLDDTSAIAPAANLPELPTDASLDVLVFGDWGTGGPGQRRLAQAMEATHRLDPPDLVLTVGDNFYPEGVESVDDPLWDRVFEKVYAGPFWDPLPIYPILGNHDRYGSVLAQIRYSEISHRWRMKGTHYAFHEAIPEDGTVLFLALDTPPLEGERNGSVEQLAWMDSVLATSEDRWVVAFGHHPLASGGWHELDEPFRLRVLPLLDGRADVYLSGHNHDLEVLQATPRLLQGVCGGGGGRDNPYPVRKTDETLEAFTNGGWCYLRIFPEVLAVELYDQAGSLRFRTLLLRARPNETD
jgi:tartrate-resistant acid phosphatase type 5